MQSIGLDISALDPTFKAHAGRGIGRYVRELHRYLMKQNSPGVTVGTFDHRAFTLPTPVESALRLLPAGRQTVRQQLVYPLQLNRGAVGRFSALHFPAHMDAPSWTNRPYILTVLDLIPLVLADLYRADNPGFRFKFARFLELRAIKGASLILAISEHTARDVVTVLGVPRERIRVTPLGVDARFFSSSTSKTQNAVRAALGLPPEAEILLYVGGIDPRKNIGALLTTMEGLRRARIDAGRPVPHLVLAGRIEEDRGYPRLVADIAQRGLTELVHLVGFVADEQLVPLYQTASVFLFPSLYEGFGLPPLEAMAAGVPVISSHTSAMPEILGDCGIGLAPERTEDWIRETLALLDASPDRRRHLVEDGRRQAERFTWDHTGATTLEAYELFLSQEQLLPASSVGTV